MRVWPVPEVPTDCAVTDREGVRWIEDPGNGRWSAPDHPTWWPHPNALALLTARGPLTEAPPPTIVEKVSP